MVSGFIFPHNNCPVRSHPFGTVQRRASIMSFSASPCEALISQRCHYFGFGGRMRRRSCAELTVAVDHCGGLPLCLFLHVACHLVFALPASIRFEMEFTNLAAPMNFSIAYKSRTTQSPRRGAAVLRFSWL